MDEDTRKLILRIQSEDLAALWSASTEDNSEIDATLRAHRRQLSLLERHLNEARRTGTLETAAEAIIDEAVASPRQIIDRIAPVLTELGDVHQPGVAYAHGGTPSLFTSSASIPSVVDATTVHPLPQVSEHPVVRLPPTTITARERLDEFLKENCGAQARYKASQVCHSRFDGTVDHIFRQKENSVDMDVVDLSSSSATSDAASYAPALQSIELSSTTTTNLEHSLDHLTISDDTSLETQASAVNKKEPGIESVLCVQPDTISETSEDLLWFSEPLSSPTLSVRDAEPNSAHCTTPPRPESLRPIPISGIRSHASTGSRSITPDSHLDVVGSNIGQHSQQSNGHCGFDLLGGRSQQLAQALSTSSALDINTFDTLPPASQKQMLGETLYPKTHQKQLKLICLYPKIRAQQPELVAKLTGMLLELDNAELLHLLNDDAALSNNVNEALRVLDESLVENEGASV